MSKREIKLDEFFKTLRTKESIFSVQKVGLQDTLLNLTSKNEINDLNIKDLFIFTNEGTLVSHIQFNKSLGNFFKSAKMYENITKLIYNLVDKFQKDDNFNFQQIFINNLKIIFLIRSQISVCAVFFDNTKSRLIKLFLMHIYITFLNFNGHLIDTLKNYRKISSSDSQINQIPEDFNNFKPLDCSRAEYFQIKIFEAYFLKGLTNHFEKVSKYLYKKEEMYLSTIKFKNMYVVEINSKEILFDLLELRVILLLKEKAKKNKKFYQNEKLWQEVLYHAGCLMNSYINEIGSQFNSSELSYKFVKLECTSSFPRLTFIIKFLPILKGLSIIHIYSQNKLSRNIENQDINYNIFKNYREFDILYGNDMKDNTNIEFKYSEPKKLMEIEKFLIEFFISIRPNLDIFHDPKWELKYFDYSLISIFEDILSKFKKNTIEQITYIINIKLYESYIKLQKKPDNTNLSHSYNITSSPNFSFLILSQEQFLRDFFKYAENENLITRLENSFYRNKDNTIILSKFEDNKEVKPEISNFYFIAKNLDRSSKKEEESKAKINSSSDYTLDQIIDGLEGLKFKKTISSDGDRGDLNMLGTSKFFSVGKQKFLNSRVNSDKDLERLMMKTQPLLSKTAYPNSLKKIQMDTKVIAEVTEGNGRPDSPEIDNKNKDIIVFQTENNLTSKEQDVLLIKENNDDDNVHRLILNQVKKNSEKIKINKLVGIDSTISVKVNKDKLDV